MNISLTPELESWIRNKVDSGLYNNASEVVREALRKAVHSDLLQPEPSLDALLKESILAVRDGDTTRLSDLDADKIMQAGRERLARGEGLPGYISGLREP
ncbi:MAG TPA: type II toxin-antitoxin system ParD family antitoxin [Thermomicrobiales bacterium]|nr:type II toxin-antitoxin system ParD family antitoxin [Thermomicrobiales bacterium]